MPEHFKNVRVINLAADQSRSGIDIFFERADQPPPGDPRVEKLRRDCEETMFVLKDVNPPDPAFGTMLNELLQGAVVGLKGPAFSVDAGQSQLDKVRNKLIRLARAERDAYLGRLLIVGAVFTSIALALAGILYFIVPSYLHDQTMLSAYRGALAWIVPVCLLHPGAALGVIFVGFVANRTITFEQIRVYDPYYFPPWLRFSYVAVVSYVLFAALWYKFVMLGVGGYLLNDVKTDPAGGLAIGLVCGISEALIVELLISRLKPVERGNA